MLVSIYIGYCFTVMQSYATTKLIQLSLEQPTMSDKWTLVVMIIASFWLLQGIASWDCADTDSVVNKVMGPCHNCSRGPPRFRLKRFQRNVKRLLVYLENLKNVTTVWHRAIQEKLTLNSTKTQHCEEGTVKKSSQSLRKALRMWRKKKKASRVIRGLEALQEALGSYYILLHKISEDSKTMALPNEKDTQAEDDVKAELLKSLCFVQQQGIKQNETVVQNLCRMKTCEDNMVLLRNNLGKRLLCDLVFTQSRLRKLKKTNRRCSRKSKKTKKCKGKNSKKRRPKNVQKKTSNRNAKRGRKNRKRNRTG